MIIKFDEKHQQHYLEKILKYYFLLNIYLLFLYKMIHSHNYFLQKNPLLTDESK